MYCENVHSPRVQVVSCSWMLRFVTTANTNLNGKVSGRVPYVTQKTAPQPMSCPVYIVWRVGSVFTRNRAILRGCKSDFAYRAVGLMALFEWVKIFRLDTVRQNPFFHLNRQFMGFQVGRKERTKDWDCNIWLLA
jgi:hypothetical protein